MEKREEGKGGKEGVDEKKKREKEREIQQKMARGKNKLEGKKMVKSKK